MLDAMAELNAMAEAVESDDPVEEEATNWEPRRRPRGVVPKSKEPPHQQLAWCTRRGWVEPDGRDRILIDPPAPPSGPQLGVSGPVMLGPPRSDALVPDRTRKLDRCEKDPSCVRGFRHGGRGGKCSSEPANCHLPCSNGVFSPRPIGKKITPGYFKATSNSAAAADATRTLDQMACQCEAGEFDSELASMLEHTQALLTALQERSSALPSLASARGEGSSSMGSASLDGPAVHERSLPPAPPPAPRPCFVDSLPVSARLEDSNLRRPSSTPAVMKAAAC